MNTRKLFSLLATISIVGSRVLGANANFNGTFTDNFDELGTAGTAAPTGWSVESEAGSHYTFAPANAPVVSGNPAPGVNPNLTAGALTLESTLTAGAATTQKGLIGYNFGTTASSADRALGTSPSGNAATILELALTNTTGAPVTALSLSYDIDRFTTTSDTNGFSSTTDPYYGVEENPGYWLYYSLNGGTTWTNVSSLNPTLAGPGGVIVPNSVGVTSVTGAPLALSGSWASGGTLELAWVDDNAKSPSPDQIIGLNNVVINSVPEPGSVLLLGLGLCGVLAARRRPSCDRNERY